MLYSWFLIIYSGVVNNVYLYTHTDVIFRLSSNAFRFCYIYRSKRKIMYVCVNARLFLNAFDRKTEENSIYDAFIQLRFVTQPFSSGDSLSSSNSERNFFDRLHHPETCFCVLSRNDSLERNISISNVALIAAKL